MTNQDLPFKASWRSTEFLTEEKYMESVLDAIDKAMKDCEKVLLQDIVKLEIDCDTKTEAKRECQTALKAETNLLKQLQE